LEVKPDETRKVLFRGEEVSHCCSNLNFGLRDFGLGRSRKDITQLDPSRTRVENVLRSHLAENWRRFRLAVEDVIRPEIEPDRMPFLILSRFSEYLAKPRTAQDQILDAKEKIND
jgi:hypothetical protein